MKKSILHILLTGLAIVTTGTTVNAQTLTQDWKSTAGIPAIADARSGTGFGGKVYTNYKGSTPNIYAWENGTDTPTALGVGGGSGVGIAADSKGNLLIVNGWAGASSMKNLKLYNASTKELTDVAVTLPDGVTAGRMDLIGRAVGDVTSETGGAVFFCGANNTKVSKIYIANGAQVVDKTKAIDFGTSMDNLTIAQPLTDDPESDEIVVRIRGSKDFFYKTEAGTWKTYTNVGASTSSGGDVVTLNGTLYTIEPTGGTYYDGFQIVDRSKGEVVATHTAEGTNNNQSMGIAIAVEKIDEYTARIYQFHPGSFAAQYTFSIPNESAGDEYPAELYIIGANYSNWTPTAGEKLTNEGNGVYKTTITGPGNFSFVTVLSSNWDEVNANRYGFSSENDNKAITLNETTAIVKGTGAINLADKGTFNVTVNLKDMTILVEGEPVVVYPEQLYLIGTVGNQFWNPAENSYVATQTETGIYTIENAVIYAASGDYGYFAFTATPSEDWSVVNASRYGPTVGDTELVKDVEGKIAMNENAYKILTAVYDITVNLNEGTIVARYKTSGINDAAVQTVKAVGGKGEIRIIGEASSVSIYNTAGQAIAINSSNSEFAVAAGIYAVVIDGKVTKVLVK